MGERENPLTLKETRETKPQMKIELNEKLVIKYSNATWYRLQKLYDKNGLRPKERYELFGTTQENAPQYVYLYRGNTPAPIHFNNTDSNYEVTVIDNVDDERILRLYASYGDEKCHIIVNRAIFRVIPNQVSASELITAIDYTPRNIYIVEAKKNFPNVVKAIRMALNTLISETLKAKYRFVIELY